MKKVFMLLYIELGEEATALGVWQREMGAHSKF